MTEFLKNSFISFDEEYKSAEIVFLGIPYDGTASYKPGSRFAPLFVREASQGLETYSPYQSESIENLKVCDMGDLVLPFGNSEKVLEEIEKVASNILKDGKKIFAFGGEHLITLPLVEAYSKIYPDLEIIHFDAHTDLREEYLGQELTHAGVIKLIDNFIDSKKIHQFGIRSGEKKEFEYAKKYLDFNPFDLKKFEEKVNLIPDAAPIYITLDIDILDPSIVPGTGTPEPGGVTFMELLNSLLYLKGRNIVGMDLVELAPNYDLSGVSNIVAAKLVREMILLF